MIWKRWKPSIPVFNNDTVQTVHSINMDELGFVYINGHNLGPRGVLIFDTKPDGNNPKFMSSVGTYYTHDCYATKTILYTADLSNGVSVYDIADKTNPVLINKFTTSSNFTHNMWTSPDEKYLYTTDERSGAYVDVYDVSDTKNIKFISKYKNQDSNISRVIPHNTYAVDNFAVTSWYTDGVLIKDMTRPDNIVKVGEYDTYFNEASLGNTTWFQGCWGVFPFLKSGNIVASDINTGLYIFKPTYKRAAYLEGKTLLKDEAGNLSPINGATVTIKAPRKTSAISDQLGEYKTGIAEDGTYKILFSHPEFGTDSAEVVLETAKVTNHDFILTGKTISGKVINAVGNTIKNNQVYIRNVGSTEGRLAKSDNEGNFSFISIGNVNKEIYATAWGYKSKLKIVTDDNPIEILLERGYYDDFFTDLGWTVTQKSQAGNWERVIPKGTILQGQISNPNADESDDLLEYAYITGNGGSQPGDNDVDNGTTILQSPEIITDYADSVTITFSRWFMNGGGNSSPNDYMLIKATDGVKTIVLDSTSTPLSAWIPVEIGISAKDLNLSKTIRITAEIGDTNPGHVVEGGLDKFRAQIYYSTISTKDLSNQPFNVYPNPTTNQIKIDIPFEEVKIYDALGRILITNNKNEIDVSKLEKGLKYIEINSKGKIYKGSFIKI
jgi:hypothetical protein